MHCLNVSADISQVIQREHDTYVSICMLQLSVKTHVGGIYHVCNECQTVIIPVDYHIIVLARQFYALLPRTQLRLRRTQRHVGLMHSVAHILLHSLVFQLRLLRRYRCRHTLLLVLIQ